MNVAAAVHGSCISRSKTRGPLAPADAANAAGAADARRLPDVESALVGDRAAGPALAMVGRSAPPDR